MLSKILDLLTGEVDKKYSLTKEDELAILNFRINYSSLQKDERENIRRFLGLLMDGKIQEDDLNCNGENLLSYAEHKNIYTNTAKRNR